MAKHYIAASMKLSYLLFLLMATAISSKAQQYNSIVNEGAEWTNFYSFFDPGAQEYPDYELRHRFIKGDTMIDSVPYKKFWFYSFDSTAIDQRYNLYLTGFLREAERKVFFRSCEKCELARNDTSEYVLYDFSLSVGDTFRTPYFLDKFSRDEHIYTVTKDTIIVVDGDSLKTLGLGYSFPVGKPSTRLYWVDSIGCTFGLLHHNFQSGWESTRFICMNNGNFDLDFNVLKDLPPTGGRDYGWLDCYHLDPAGVPEKVDESTITWLANEGLLTLKGLELNSQISVYDISGKLIESGIAHSENLILGPIETPGVYVVGAVSSNSAHSFLVSIP